MQWPRVPHHRFSPGATIVTAATLHKKLLFAGEALDELHETLLAVLPRHGWTAEAWAVFGNHYHFVAHPEGDPKTLPTAIREIHSRSARMINARDESPGRQVWHNYWETSITNNRSYLARLRYVHENAVRHRLVERAVEYPYCSARWFEETAPDALQNVLAQFKIDRVNVIDFDLE